ncbi:hypothetical protein C943_02993 [Mariniradius saccharolyticus AK6]|uniref:Uncharacterized protein n=1 Tax=Mariniradius saccharolyticus AK6 TaxID=1239962 RepID=M7XCE7_9BACT|nr:hypothetical protein C943_02993 [Mariniradius saccharolyticus AK6]
MPNQAFPCPMAFFGGLSGLNVSCKADKLIGTKNGNGGM